MKNIYEKNSSKLTIKKKIKSILNEKYSCYKL